ncbi:unnamed protein product [Polarella glacialis]|uniref:Uncharacterized protein n=1 Tax=Polarella glacialis TaxID=89957 RepID=A0A813JQV5_POLGL|nr:unnamed protein product [Polarella glacialis]
MALRNGLPLSVAVGVILLAFPCQAYHPPGDPEGQVCLHTTQGPGWSGWATTTYGAGLYSEEDEVKVKLLTAILQPLLIGGSLVCIAVSTLCYWCLYIRPDPLTFIPARAVVPDDLKGRWKYGLFDC